MTSTPLSHLTTWNPLRGLRTPELISRIEAAEQGDYAALQWTFRAVERRNATVRAIKRKLTGALGGLDWNIKVRDDVPGEQQATAERHAAALRQAYERVQNLRKALIHLCLADFRGFAHLEKIYRGSQPSTLNPQLSPWDVTELRIVPQWHWKRDGMGAPWRYDAQARLGSAGGTPITPRDWITREVDDPASEIFALCHLDTQLTDADWAGFLETYGIPAIFVEGPPNVAKDREKEYQAAAEAIVGDGRGYLPNGSKVHSVDAPAGHSEVFEKRLRWLQELMVLAGTGGILTMLSAPTGIGQGASGEHQDTWLDVASAIALDVSEVMQAQFDRPLLARLFPGEEPLAYFEFAAPSEEDVAAHVANAKTLGEAGFDVDAEELSEKTGYKLTRRAAPASSSSSSPSSSHPEAEDDEDDDEEDEKGSVNQPTPESALNPQPSTLNPQPPLAPRPSPLDPAKPPGAPDAPSRAGEAEPGLVQAALAHNAGIEERWLAPVKAELDRLEALLLDPGADIGAVADAIETAAAKLPDLLGALDTEALAEALNAAAGTAAIQGLRDALAGKVQPRG